MSNKKTSPVNILQFMDYRSFLQSAFDDKLKHNPQWSYSAFSRQIGLKSNTSIIKILRGQREAGPEICRKISAYFNFSNKEQGYFNDLVRLSKSKRDPGETFQIMSAIKQRNKKFRLLSSEEFAATSQWWFYAIRQMTKLGDFRNDPRWILSRLAYPVSMAEIKRAISGMIELGLLIQDGKRIAATNSSINTSDDIASEAIKRFHESMLDNARVSLRKFQVEERMIVGHTIGLHKDDIPAAKDFLNGMLDAFCEKFEVKDPDAIYQMQVQLFPLTKF